MVSQFADMTSSSIFFGVDFFDSSSLVTGPSFMSILPLVLELCYKGLTRSLEIGNTPVLVLPNIWRLEQLRDTNFGTNVPNEILPNASKCHGDNMHVKDMKISL